MKIRENLQDLSHEELIALSQKSLNDIFSTKVEVEEAKKRFAFDDFIDEKFANELIGLAQKYAFAGEGYDGDEQPHNKKEIYSSKKVESLENEGKLKNHPILDLREDILTVIRKYFNKDYIDIMFSQLAVRKTLNETEPYLFNLPMSHEYHLDIHTKDEQPRTHTAILFLNDDFLGGNFMLQESSLSPERAIPPKTGRLLGFDAKGTYHGTSHIYNGCRFVYIFWFVENI